MAIVIDNKTSIQLNIAGYTLLPHTTYIFPDLVRIYVRPFLSKENQNKIVFTINDDLPLLQAILNNLDIENITTTDIDTLKVMVFMLFNTKKPLKDWNSYAKELGADGDRLIDYIKYSNFR